MQKTFPALEIKGLTFQKWGLGTFGGIWGDMGQNPIIFKHRKILYQNDAQALMIT